MFSYRPHFLLSSDGHECCCRYKTFNPPMQCHIATTANFGIVSSERIEFNQNFVPLLVVGLIKVYSISPPKIMPSHATPDSSTLEDKRYAAVHSPQFDKFNEYNVNVNQMDMQGFKHTNILVRNIHYPCHLK